MRLAGKHLAEPRDIFALSGKSLKDFIGENGELDVELVAQTANELLGTRPGLKPVQPAIDLTQGHGGNPAKITPTWGAFLKD